MQRYSQIVGIAALIVLCGTELVSGHGGRRAKLIEQAHLTESVVHFVYSVPVGKGAFDTIRVHRVVRVDDDGKRRSKKSEKSAKSKKAKSKKTRKPKVLDTEHSVLLIHGAGGTFANAFLAGTLPSAETEDQSMAVVLAKHDIDVWGIDLAWSLVPFDTTDVSFMKDWGLQRQIDEVSIALSFARKKRRGKDPMHLLGYSLGGPIGYALLNEEASRACKKRQVKGWIPLDTALRSDDPSTTERACAAAAASDALIASGVFRDGATAGGVQIGFLARVDPDGPSPFAPGLTNRQFGLIVVALPPPNPPPAANNPFYHFFAGVLAAQSGLPIDLVHVTPSLAFEWAESLGGGPPIRLLAEAAHGVCGDLDQPFDDNLAQITVPVLYVGADGAFGDAGVFGNTLLGSSDVTTEIVDLEPPERRLFDYGHIDLATASNAGFLAWDGIAEWIRQHDDDQCEDKD